jgi:murein DD-endopeptidase MepM/ murein hydrolase activator NlpD
MRTQVRVVLLTLVAVFAIQQRYAPVRTVEASVLPAPLMGEAGLSNALIIPVAGVKRSQLHDDFGQPRSGGRHHAAIDIRAPRGTPVLATTDGMIAKLHSSGAGGLTIYLSDGDQQTVYYYAHLDHYAAGLTEGQLVQRGEVIGFVGTTGNAPENVPHLHFGIEHVTSAKHWSKGEPANPYPILLARGVTKDIG